jgi:nucleotide-binding universal stress UspA family protein
MRHSTVPLLLVRAQPSGENNGRAIYTRNRIVVPLDGSEMAMRALPVAKALGETLGAPLALVRVVQPAATTPMSDARDPLDFARATGKARDYLTRVSRKLSSIGCAATSEVAIDNNPARAIIGHAEGDLVVMSTHSWPPLGRAVLGSVTDKVVRGSSGPVVVVPASTVVVGEVGVETPTADDEADWAVPLAAGAAIY